MWPREHALERIVFDPILWSKTYLAPSLLDSLEIRTAYKIAASAVSNSHPQRA